MWVRFSYSIMKLRPSLAMKSVRQPKICPKNYFVRLKKKNSIKNCYLCNTDVIKKIIGQVMVIPKCAKRTKPIKKTSPIKFNYVQVAYKAKFHRNNHLILKKKKQLCKHDIY